MSPELYDAWYRSPRGAWIGEVEYRLLRALLVPRAGESVLDIGCGTGYFTRRFALAADAGEVVGLDCDAAAVRYAASQDSTAYVLGDAQRLPFADRSFDLVVAVTAVCFVDEPRLAVAEMLRVARRRIALGLLNRQSCLWWQKGRKGGKGAYRGAYWHTCEEARDLFANLPVDRLQMRTAIYLPTGGALSRKLEPCLQSVWPRGGAFIAVATGMSNETGL